MKSFHANGKLLITGEYLILKGAKSLAIPTKFGQSLHYDKTKNDSLLVWNSLDNNNKTWFSATFDLIKSAIVNTSNDQKAEFLLKILVQAQHLSNESKVKSGEIVTNLNFERNWGLGTSSTLIWNISKLYEINPMKLHFSVSNGSGYDVACAGSDLPITYRLNNHNESEVNSMKWDPDFKKEIQFVFLNKKQNSQTEVDKFNKAFINSEDIKHASKLTEAIIRCHDLNDFEKLIDNHEKLLGKCLNQIPVKEKIFSDYPGAIKSLGAWGGDFILATRKNHTYFHEKGFNTVFSFEDMILS